MPGAHTDQRLVRLASRRMYRELLEGGVRIYEYRPAMTHVKALMVDGVWAVIGTTNVDNRSFEHNDEVNVAFREPEVTARLRRDFEADLAASDEITLERVAARGRCSRSWSGRSAGSSNVSNRTRSSGDVRHSGVALGCDGSARRRSIVMPSHRARRSLTAALVSAAGRCAATPATSSRSALRGHYYAEPATVQITVAVEPDARSTARCASRPTATTVPLVGDRR